MPSTEKKKKIGTNIEKEKEKERKQTTNQPSSSATIISLNFYYFNLPPTNDTFTNTHIHGFTILIGYKIQHIIYLKKNKK